MDPATIARLRALREAKKAREAASSSKQPQPPPQPQPTPQSQPPQESQPSPPPQPPQPQQPPQQQLPPSCLPPARSVQLPPAQSNQDASRISSSSSSSSSLSDESAADEYRRAFRSSSSSSGAAAAGSSGSGSGSGSVLEYTPESFMAVNTDAPIGADNRGYKLLLKMGWREGTGIGKEGSEGITAPVGVTNALDETQSVLGIGKAAQYSSVLNDTAGGTGEKRRRLESNRDAPTLALREAAEAAADRRAVERKAELSAFFCDCCNKQYANVAQWQEHLSSYGHNHARNMRALRAAEAERRKAHGGLSKEEKRSKEARREAKALARRMAAAQGGGSGSKK